MKLLQGILNYRAALYAVGVTKGFLWVDGSFVEDVEMIRGREPADVDAVLFFRPPNRLPGQPQLSPQVDEFNQQRVRSKYEIHAFFVNLDGSSESIVAQSAYWYGVLSHQRDTMTWKGFIQLSLDQSADHTAQQELNLAVNALRKAGGT